MGARRGTTAGIACALLITACTGGDRAAPTTLVPDTPTRTSDRGATTTPADWSELPVPQRGARIRVLLPLGSGLLALGSIPGRAIEGSSDRAPGAWRTDDLRSWTRIPVHPTTGYGELAEFIRGGVYRGRVSAFGHATGGAHGNPRPTIWTGDRSGLNEHLQSFTLFGGLAAISQTGEAVGAGGSLITGQWEGRTGYGAAVWTSPDGAEWVRHQDVPGLAPARGEQTTARGAAESNRAFLVVGDNQTAAGSTQALAWTASGPDRWRRIVLPSPASATAARASCRGSSCTVIGSRVSARPRLLCWTVDSHRARIGVPGPGAALLEPDQLLDTRAALYAVVGTDQDARLVKVDRGCREWRAIALPSAAPDAAVGVLGQRMVLATTNRTTSRLWVGPLP